jgi:hypothetical protein
MSAWLDPLRATLDREPGPTTFFFRDDDAGWCDERLFALLEVFERRGAPLDLAVIPQALSAKLARELGAWWRAMPLGVHQHGFAHLNHELLGRKC